MIYVLGVSQHSLLVVPRVEPKLEDLSDEFRREEGRLEDRRDPRDVALRVLGIRPRRRLGEVLASSCYRDLGTGARNSGHTKASI